MAQFLGATLAWSYTTGGETAPDAFQVRLGTVSGVYSVCACYAASVRSVTLRDLLPGPGTYYGMVIGSSLSTEVVASTEMQFLLGGNLVRVG